MYKQLILLSITIVFFFTQFAYGDEGEIVFVETEVNLQPDGKAIITYTVQWQVIFDKLHGFYFGENEPLNLYSISENSYAFDSSGNRYNLNISSVDDNGPWDIIIADEQGVSSGTVTFVLFFKADLAEAGFLTPHRLREGQEWAVFNWSPVRWDKAYKQQHYTLKILTPHVLPLDENPRDHVEKNGIIHLEGWVEKKFFISYQRGHDNRLYVILVKEFPGNMFSMENQFYMPSQWFTIPKGSSQGGHSGSLSSSSVKKKDEEDFYIFKLIGLLSGMVLIGLLIYYIGSGKHKHLISTPQKKNIYRQ